MKKEEALGYQLRRTTNLVNRFLDTSIAQEQIKDLTGIHGWIIRYLVQAPGDVFQKDIEVNFSMQRSTASRMLQLMERNGYITRESVPYDKRLKKVVPTEKLYNADDFIHHKLDYVNVAMKQGISEEELAMFFQVIHKITINLEIELASLQAQKEDSL